MRTIKKIFDLVFAFIGLVILTPLFLIIALFIKLDSKGPVFFRQERIGLNGVIFKIYKFRTMIENAENIGSGLKTSSNDPRITRVGNFLRKTSLDELPQLINILKGEMSFVGPRPAPIVLVDRLTETERKRLSVKPGVTGWAQINGRTKLSWKEKFKKDVWYVNNYSIILDIKIIFITIKYVLLKKDIYSDRYDEDVKEMNSDLNK